MSSRPAALMVAVLVLAACGDKRKPSGALPTAVASVATSSPARATASPTVTSTAPSIASGSPSATPSASGVASASPSGTSAASAGTGDCKIARGPLRLSTTGAVTFGPSSGGLLSFGTNKDGAPVWESPKFPDPPRVTPGASLTPRASAAPPALLPGPAPSSSAAEGASDRTRLPACAVAGGFTFCADGEGAIHRRPLAGGEDKVVARGRKGTPVAAAAAGGHTYYAFLANQKTTEGVIVRAFAAVDDETPIPLSEEGSGATYIGLVGRDADVLAMYIDARTALTPVHARTLRVESRLARGADAVIFVGGGADSHVRGAVGRGASGPALLFVPGSPDDKRYGFIAIPVDGEPKDDMPGKWSYDPAQPPSPALVATLGASPVRILRSHPETDDPGAVSVLNLGHVADDGAVQDKCVIAKLGPFSDLAVAVDDKGSLWVAYTNGNGTWVEQRGGDAKEK